MEEAAARAYDLAALKYWGPTTFTNFPVQTFVHSSELLCKKMEWYITSKTKILA